MKRTQNLKTSDRIFLAIVGVLILSLIYTTAFSQTSTGTAAKVLNEARNDANAFNAIQGDRKFVVTELYATPDSGKWRNLATKTEYVTDGSKSTIQAEGDTARLFFSTDGRPLVGSVTWKYADQLFDTTWITKETYDDPAGAPGKYTEVVNIARATNQSKPGVYNKSFSFVNVTSSPSSWKTTCTCERIEFFGEIFQGHGWIKFFADGVQVGMMFKGNPGTNGQYYTDFSIPKPSFHYVWPKATPTSAPGTHTFEVKTDAGNQAMTDMIRTLNYTLKPR